MRSWPSSSLARNFYIIIQYYKEQSGRLTNKGRRFLLVGVKYNLICCLDEKFLVSDNTIHMNMLSIMFLDDHVTC